MTQGGLLRMASLALVAWTGLAGMVMADDWVVDRLRGEVLVAVDGSWQPLRRGDIVSDDSAIKSLDGSRVTFTRGAEAIELSGATEIRIFDQQGQKMTTVMQAYGTVTVEAERLQIQHFSIQTPYLAAIVKGTRFTVHSDDTQSNVEVERGLVQVQDYMHGVATDITPGQSAVVSPEIVLDVSGRGAHAPLVTLDGELVSPAEQGSSGNGNGGSNAGGNGHGNAFGHDKENGNSGNGSNAGGNGNGNAYGHDKGNGNSGNGHGNGNSNAGGNGNSGNSNSNAGGNGNGNSGNSSSNAGGNGNGNAYGRDKDNGNSGEA